MKSCNTNAGMLITEVHDKPNCGLYAVCGRYYEIDENGEIKQEIEKPSYIVITKVKI